MDVQNGTSRTSSDRPGSAISARDKGKAKALSPGPGPEESKSGKYGLGDRPKMDTAKAEELCGIEEGQSLETDIADIVLK